MKYQNEDSIGYTWCIGSHGKKFCSARKWSYFNCIMKGEFKDLKKKENKTKYLIVQSLDKDVFEKITLTTSLKEAWQKLEISYKGVWQVKKIRLQIIREEFECNNVRKVIWSFNMKKGKLSLVYSWIALSSNILHTFKLYHSFV